MFIDDCPYLENNHGTEDMNMRPMPYMPWGNSLMHNPNVPNTTSSMNNINHDNMNRSCTNITNEDSIYTDTASPMAPNETQSTPKPSTQFIPSVQDDILYNQGFLKTQIGKRVKIDFLIGTNMFIDKEGTLVGVGISYVLIDEVDTNHLIMADMYSIKFVTIFD